MIIAIMIYLVMAVLLFMTRGKKFVSFLWPFTFVAALSVWVGRFVMFMKTKLRGKPKEDWKKLYRPKRQ